MIPTRGCVVDGWFEEQIGAGQGGFRPESQVGQPLRRGLRHRFRPRTERGALGAGGCEAVAEAAHRRGYPCGERGSGRAEQSGEVSGRVAGSALTLTALRKAAPNCEVPVATRLKHWHRSICLKD